MSKLRELYEASESAGAYAAAYLERVRELMEAIDTTAIERTVEALESTAVAGGTIFCAGNGGSAAIASHLVCDLNAGGAMPGQRRLRAVSLSDNTPTLTALANDLGYDNVFVEQLRGRVAPGDTLLAISVSGNSENVLRAVRLAAKSGATTVAWTGFDGGRIAMLCDVRLTLHTTTDEYGPVEAIFSHVAHLVAGYMTLKRDGRLSRG
jgi:phosphoheptose isomerase